MGYFENDVAAFAAGLAAESDISDAHSAVYGLAHVVDCQSGDADGGHRLHLDAGLGGRTGGGADVYRGALVVEAELDR